MKSFKKLMLLIFAVALSYGANGSPTNVTTNGWPTKASPEVLQGIIKGLQDVANPIFDNSGWYHFPKYFTERLAWVRPYNYIVCSVKHTYVMDGTQGKEWDRAYVWYTDPTDPTGPKQSYDVIVAGSGWFERQGKGGWDNWGWNGFIPAWQDKFASHVTFITPPQRSNEGASEGSGD